MSFFESFGSAMEVEAFTPVSFATNDSDMMTIVRSRAEARTTGKRMDMDLRHFFRFRAGTVWSYRGGEDSAQTEAARRT